MKHRQAVHRRASKIAAVVAAAAVFTFGATMLVAGERPRPSPSPERSISRLGEKLDLTSEQKELLAPVIEGGFARHREIEKKYGKQTRDLKRAEREEQRAVESDVDGQLISILSPEQMEEYRNLKENRRSRHQRETRRRGGEDGMRGGPMSPDRVLMHLSERLELTADQEDRLLPIIEDSFDQRRELFEDLKSQEVIERSAVRSEMEDLAADMEARAAAVLSAEQMEEFRQIQEERRSRKDGGAPFGRRGRF